MGKRRATLLILPLLAVGACRKQTLVVYDVGEPPVVRTSITQLGMTDGRARFREIFCERFETLRGMDAGVPDNATCDDYLHRLGGEADPPGTTTRLAVERLHVRIVGSYLGDAIPGGILPFGPSVDHLRAQGYDIEYVTVTGGGSADYNAEMIATTLSSLPVPDDDVLLLLGYSKGTVDIMHFLVNFPDLASDVDAVLSVSGAVNGSPLIDTVPEFLADLLLWLGGGESGDGGGFESLRRSVRTQWLSEHRLPEHVRYYSLVSFTDRWNISSILRGNYDRMSEVDPRNDSAVLFYDQVIPRGMILGYANGDHLAVAVPIIDEAPLVADLMIDHNQFPRTALLEAMLTYVLEDFAE